MTVPAWILTLLILATTANRLPAQESEQLPASGKRSHGTASVFDRGIGFMDAGEMKIIGVENFGLLCGWDPPSTAWYPGANHGVWGELRWIAPVICMPPGPWGAQQTEGPALPEDRSDQYNTIESFSCMHLHEGDNYSYTDWEAKDDASVQYHGWLTEDNIPMIAISTLQETWPQGYFDEQDQWVYTPGEYHWPGGWALDPDPTSPTYNQPIWGRFVSSKDIFFLADDKYNGVREGAVTARYGYPVGIDMEVAGYSYSSPLYEDVVFFNINFIFRTREQITDPASRFFDPDRRFYDGSIENVYFACFVDPDLPGAYTATNQQTHPWAEDDYALIYDWDHDGTIDVFIAHDKQDYMVDEDRPQNAGPVSAYGINFFRTPRVDPSDPLSPEIGITGFHWFDQDVAMRPHSVTADWEKVLYAISAGQPELVPEEADLWFHGEDPQVDDVELLRDFQESLPPGSRPDVQFWFSSGPFTISPGDTIPIHIGIVGGVPQPGGYDDEGFPTITDPEIRFAEIFSNLAQADELYEHNFQGSGPPDPPDLQAAGTLVYDDERNPVIHGEPGRVTLYWNSASEQSEDIITHLLDFEGYRIYKTLYDPRSPRDLDWGEEIYDYEGNLLGYRPQAQFDLVDEWSGPDPYNPWFQLGENTGLQYTWTDTDVVNGVHYRYAITAYDFPDTLNGVGSQETTIGHDPKEVHIVEVVPGAEPAGWIPGAADSLALHLTGTGTGFVIHEVVDPVALTGHPYLITFADTSQAGVDELLVSVCDTLSGEVLVDRAPGLPWTRGQEDAAAPRPIVEGLGYTIINDAVIEMRLQSWTQVLGDSSDYVFSALEHVGDMDPLAADYLVAFGDSSSKFLLMPDAAYVPFQVFNLSADPWRENPLDLYVRNPLAPWTSGDFVYLLEPDVDHRSWQFSITWEPDAVEAPESGEAYLYLTRKPFTAADSLLVRSSASGVEEGGDPLAAVRVVPNPYIGGSSTELSGGSYTTYDLRFVNLPPRCTIRIYTLSGDHVRTIDHDNPTFGEAHWDLLTEDRLEAAYGVYVYTLSAPGGHHRRGKFAVIR